MICTFNKKYDCKLSTRAICDIENNLNGKSLINALFESEGIPPLSLMITILYHSGKRLNHWKSIDEVYDLFDDYCENDDGSVAKLALFIADLVSKSDCIKKKSDEEVKDSEVKEAELKN